MSTELVTVATADEIATLPPEDRAVMVTHALVESKQWLEKWLESRRTAA